MKNTTEEFEVTLDTELDRWDSLIEELRLR